MANSTSLPELGALNGRVQLTFGDTGIFGGGDFQHFLCQVAIEGPDVVL
jgi:hypothetical protein